jgi:hypothetical protein
LQALEQANIVATKVVAYGHGDGGGDDHHLFDLNPPDADCSLIFNLTASGIWIILQPAMGLKYAPTIPERPFMPFLKPRVPSACTFTARNPLRRSHTDSKASNPALPDQVLCEPSFLGECEYSVLPTHSHSLHSAAVCAAQPHSRALIKLRSFDHLTRVSTAPAIPEVG